MKTSKRKMGFLLSLDLFGKEPDLYYEGQSKKYSFIGLIASFLYISIYCAFLIFKLERMLKRKDVNFCNIYAYNKEVPLINIINEEFYGAFAMGDRIDETLYHIKAQYVMEDKNSDNLNDSHT